MAENNFFNDNSGILSGDESRKTVRLTLISRHSLPDASRAGMLHSLFEQIPQRMTDTGSTSPEDYPEEMDEALAPFEKERSQQIAEQIIRPTGLLDPEVEVRPVKGQVDDLLTEIRLRTQKGERVLVTTLTKKMAEDLSEYLISADVKCRYMHHDIDAMERMELIRDLRKGTIDVLVGINLLREGLDLPEVSLVAILDADKEGFLRSETSLVQTIGRAARHVNGRVIMYADKMTGSMERAITETNRRRGIQKEYNEKHGIIPKSIVKELRDPIAITSAVNEQADPKKMSETQKKKQIEALTKQMKEAAKVLDFETAAALRDRIKRLM